MGGRLRGNVRYELMSDQITRSEFDRLEDRMNQIDMTGTRGVAVLAVQLQELAKDMAAHEAQHKQEMDKRAAHRKWLFMAIIAAIAAIDGPIVTVLLARGK